MNMRVTIEFGTTMGLLNWTLEYIHYIIGHMLAYSAEIRAVVSGDIIGASKRPYVS